MASLAGGAGLVLLAFGILTVAVAFAMMVFSQDDAATQGNGVLGEPSEDDAGADPGATRVGQTLAVGGGAIAFLGLVLIVVGRGDKPIH
jgi:hypothetical protein